MRSLKGRTQRGYFWSLFKCVCVWKLQPVFGGKLLHVTSDTSFNYTISCNYRREMILIWPWVISIFSAQTWSVCFTIVCCFTCSSCAQHPPLLLPSSATVVPPVCQWPSGTEMGSGTSLMLSASNVWFSTCSFAKIKSVKIFFKKHQTQLLSWFSVWMNDDVFNEKQFDSRQCSSLEKTFHAAKRNQMELLHLNWNQSHLVERQH